MAIESTGATQAAHPILQDGASRSPSPLFDTTSSHGLAQAPPVKSAPQSVTPLPPSALAAGTLQFNLDPETSQVIVQIVDGNSTEIIQKIPAEDVLAFAKTMDATTGLLIKTKA